MEVIAKQDETIMSDIITGTPFWYSGTLFVRIPDIDFRHSGSAMSCQGNAVKLLNGRIHIIQPDSLVKRARVRVVNKDV